MHDLHNIANLSWGLLRHDALLWNESFELQIWGHRFNNAVNLVYYVLAPISYLLNWPGSLRPIPDRCGLAPISYLLNLYAPANAGCLCCGLAPISYLLNLHPYRVDAHTSCGLAPISYLLN